MGDIDVSKEREYSALNELYSYAQWHHCNTYSKIKEHQRGLIPLFLNIEWKKTETYFYNEEYKESRDYFETCLIIKGIVNIICLNDPSSRFYIAKVKDLYNQKKIQAFFLFINNLFIPWDRITFVRSDENITLLISGMDKEYAIQTVKILHIPTTIHYSDDGSYTGGTKILGFNRDGYFDPNSAPINVYNTDANLNNVIFYEGYNKFDTGIDVNRRLTEDNVILFKQDGSLNTDSSIDMEAYNILTTDGGMNDKRYAIVSWSNKSCNNEMVSLRADNHDYVKQLIRNKAFDPDLDMNLVTKEFDNVYNPSLGMDTNVSNEWKWMFGRDYNKIDSAFDSKKNIRIMEYDANDIYRKVRASSDRCSLTMLRDVYKGNQLETYVIIFLNGYADTYLNNNIIYYPDKFTIKFPSNWTNKGISAFTIVYFMNVQNKLFIDSPNSSFSASNLGIDNEDIIAMPIDGNSNAINTVCKSTIDGNNTVSVTDSYWQNNGYRIGITSRNRFLHHRYYTSNNMIELEQSDFGTAYNVKNFIIFYDGKFMNSNDYAIAANTYDASYTRSSSAKITILFKFVAGATRTIDVYYCSSANVHRCDLNGDLLICCIKDRATASNQKRFKVPYPFDKYPREKDAFFCIKGSSYVDKEAYVLDGDYLEFIDTEDEFDYSKDLIFVFPYYRPDWDNDSDDEEESRVHLQTYTTRATKDGQSTFTFDDPRSVHTSFPQYDSVYLFVGPTFIDPSRYVFANNVVTFVNGETLPNGTLLTLAVNYDDNDYGKSLAQVATTIIEADVDGQLTFDIPAYLRDYSDSFFIMRGSVLVSPNRYYVTADQSKIMFLNTFDGVPKNKHMLIVFLKNRNDTGSNLYNTPSGVPHILTKSVFIKPTADTRSVRLKSRFYRPLMSGGILLLFINSTYCPDIRYDVIPASDGSGDYDIQMKDPNDYFGKGKSIVVVYAYEHTRYYKSTSYDIEGKDIIYFTDEFTAMRNSQTSYTIPFPYPPFTDTAFFVTIGGSFIPESEYTVSGDTITFLDSSVNMNSGRKIRFTFVHNKGFSYIAKREASVPLYIGQEEVDIPSPFDKVVNLERRMIVTYGNQYLDKDRYVIDNYDRKLLLTDLDITENGRNLNFMFFYTGNQDNGAIAFLPQSGYICFYKKHIDRNYMKEWYMIFVNGELIPKSKILDVTNSLKKISYNINTRYDLCVLNCGPIITETKDMYSSGTDDWGGIIEPLKI